MLFRIYLVISVFANGLLFAQDKVSNPDRETFGSVQQKSKEKSINTTSKSAKAVIQNLVIMEKSIAEKVTDLERLQFEAAEFNKDFQKEILIINERPSTPTRDAGKFLITRHVEYTFESGNKIKEIRVVSRHKSLTNDMNSVIRVVSFAPGNVESIKVTVDSLDSRAKGILESETYKNFVPEVKLQALKAIDNTLLDTIFRLDTFIQRNQISKNEKNKKQLEGL